MTGYWHAILEIVKETLVWGPGLLANVTFFALTGVVLWARWGHLAVEVEHRVSILVIVGILGILSVGFISVILALIGCWHTGWFFGLWVALLALVAWDAWRKGLVRTSIAGWQTARSLPKWLWVILGLWLLLYSRPHEAIIGGRDPGVYVNTAAQIVERGALAVSSPFFAALPPDLQQYFSWYRFPGFVWIGSDEKVLPQFLPFYPALMAPGYSVLGYRGALTVLPFIMLLFSMVIAELAMAIGRDLGMGFSDRLFIAGVAGCLFLINPAMYWFGREANADVLFGLWVFAFLFFWAKSAQHECASPAGRNSPGFAWGLALGAWGASMLTKIDSWYILPVFLLILFLYRPEYNPSFSKRLGAMWIGLGILYVFVAYRVSYPYMLLTLYYKGVVLKGVPIGLGDHAVLSSHRYIPVLVAALCWAIITGITHLPSRWCLYRCGVERQRWELRSPYLTLGATAIVFIVMASGEMPLRPARLLEGLSTIGGYIHWPVLLLALIGVLTLLWQVSGSVSGTALLLLSLMTGSFVALNVYWHDQPWNVRRATSVVIPCAMLLASIGVGSLIGQLRDRENLAGYVSKLWPAIMVILVAVASFPMVEQDAFLFRNRQSEGAINYFRHLDAIFPSDAVIYSPGAAVLNLFGPPLTVKGNREILLRHAEQEALPLSSAIVDELASIALKQGRPFFYVSETPSPPEGHFVFARYWRGEWDRKFVFGEDGPQSIHVVSTPVPYYVYQALDPSDSRRGDALVVAVYEAEALPSQTGERSPDPWADNGWAYVAQEGRDKAAALVYGPYEVFLPGYYVACYRLRADATVGSQPGTALILGDGRQQLAYAPIDRFSSRYDFLQVPFQVEEPTRIEFAMIFSGSGTLWLDRIEILSVDKGADASGYSCYIPDN